MSLLFREILGNKDKGDLVNSVLKDAGDEEILEKLFLSNILNAFLCFAVYTIELISVH